MFGFSPSSLFTAKCVASQAIVLSLLLFSVFFLLFFPYILPLHNCTDWIMPITAHLAVSSPLVRVYLISYKFHSESLVGLKWTSGGHLLVLSFYSCLHTRIFKIFAFQSFSSSRSLRSLSVSLCFT